MILTANIYIGLRFLKKELWLLTLLLIATFSSGFSAPSPAISIHGEPMVAIFENADAVFPAPPPDNLTVCEGSNALFQVFSGGAWQWQESIGGGPFLNIPGQISPNLNLPGVSITMNGNQYLCVVDNIATFPATLTVLPNAVVGSVTGLSPMCRRSTALYSATGVVLGGGTGTWSSSNTFVAVVNSSSGLVTAINGGTCIITYTISSGCGSGTKSAFQQLTVTPDATITSVAGISPLCKTETTTFTAIANLGGGIGSWSSSNPAVATVSNSGVVTAISAGNSNIIYTITGACNADQSAQRFLTVWGDASVSSISGTTPLCNATSATYLANGLVLGGGTGIWSSSNPAVATINPATGLVSTISVGTTTIGYTITGGCNTIPNPNVQQQLTVTPDIPSTTLLGISSICKGTQTTYTATNIDPLTTGSWTSSNPSIATVNAFTGLVTAIASGSCNIIYTVTGGCSVQQLLTVLPDPFVRSISGVNTLCRLASSLYTANGVVLGGGTGIWSSSDTNIATVNPTSGLVTAVGPGTCEIVYTISGGCNITPEAKRVLTVTDDAAVASVNGKSPMCQTETATYVANGVDLGGGTGTWSSSDLSIARVSPTTGLVTAVGVGTCNIIYTITGGCTGTKSASQLLTVTPDASVTSVSGTSPLCKNVNANFVANGVILGGGTGAWSSSNSAVATVNANSGLVTAVSEGTCDIIFTITGGCNGTPTKKQTLTVTPDAAVTSVTGVSSLCRTETGSFTANGVILGGGTGAWSTSNSAVATVNSVTGNVLAVGTGTCDIIYTISGGCGGTKSALQPLTVIPDASAGSIIGTSPLCKAETAVYTLNNVILSGGTGAWSSSNSAVATVNSVTGIVTAIGAGSCNILYTVTGGCIGTQISQKAVTVTGVTSVSGLSPMCIASTSTYNTTGAVLNGGNGVWSSTNSAVATVNSATGSVTAVGVGTCDIVYTIIGGCNGTPSARQPLVVTPDAAITSVTGISSLCQTETANYTVNGVVLSGGTGLWNSSNPAVATVNSVTGQVTAVGSGTSDITYTITGGCGGSKSSFQTLTVNTSPTAVISGTQTICSGSSGNLSVALTGSQPWSITYTDGTTPVTINGITVSPKVIPISPATTKTYTLTAVSDANCSGTSLSGNAIVTVSALPAPTISSSGAPCIGATIVYSTESGKTNYDWSISAGGTRIAGGTPANNTITIAWNATGAQFVSVNYSDAGLCTATTPKVENLTVNPVPATPVISASGPTNICQGGNVTLSSGLSVGLTYIWTPSGPNNPNNTVTSTGVYSLIISNSATKCSSLPSNSIPVTVNPTPIPPSSLGILTACWDGAGSPPAIDANSITNSSFPIFWFNSAVGGNIVPSTYNLPGAGEMTIYAEARDNSTPLNCTSLTRTPVVLKVVRNPTAPVKGVDVSDDLSICETNPLTALTATILIPPPAGTVFNWYDLAAGGSPVSPTLNAVTSKTFYAEASNGFCTSNLPRTPVVLTISPAPPPPIPIPVPPQCVNATPQTITAMATLPPGLPSGSTIKWYDTPAGGVPLTTPNDTGTGPNLSVVGNVTYYAETKNFATNCVSTLRTPVKLSISDRPAPPTGSPIFGCETLPIQPLIANATPPPGSNVVWYDADYPGGNVVASPTWSSVSTKSYWAESDNGTCTSSTSLVGRTEVKLTINPAPAAPVFSKTGDTKCYDGLPLSVPGVTNVAWFNVPTGGTELSTPPSLTEPTSVSYYAEAINSATNCRSLTRTAYKLTVTSTPADPISGGDQVVCAGSTIPTLTATATSPDGAVILFYANPTGGTSVSPVLNTIIINGVDYWAEAEIGTCKSRNRTKVHLQINPAPATPVSLGPLTLCANDPLIATGNFNDRITLQGGTYSVEWFNGPSDPNKLDHTPTFSELGMGTTTFYAGYIDETTSCQSQVRVAVSVTINALPNDPVSAGDVIECAQKPVQLIKAEVLPPADGSTIIWYSDALLGSVVKSPTLNQLGTITYYAEAELNKCKNPNRTPVTLTINNIISDPILKATGQDSLVSCESNPIVPLDAKTLFTVIPGISIVCYDAATGGFEVPPTLDYAGTKTLYAVAKNDTTQCESLNRIPVTLVIQAAPAAPSSSGDIFECAQITVQTLDANKSITPATGTTVVWYTLAKGGTVVASPTLNKANSTITYYAESVDDITKCTSLTRTAVKLTLGSTTASAASNSPLALGQTLQLKGGPELAGNTFLWTDPNGFNFSTMDVIIPNVTEAAAGKYMLTVTSLNGCSATDSIIVVLDIARAEAQLPVCIGATLYLSGFPDNMKSYAWSGPNGYTSSEQNPSINSVTIANSGTYKLTVTNASNATSSDTVSVSFKPLPIPIAEAATVCPAGTMQLKALPNGMTSYTWTSQNGSTWNLQNPPAMPFPNPPQSFKLTVVDWNGCEASKTITPTPFQPKATSNSPVCAGDTLRFRGEPNGLASYTWTGPNSFFSNLQSPSRNNVNPATDTGDYTLTVVDNAGCTFSTKVTVSFNQAVPIPTIVPNLNPICEGSTLILRGGPNGMAVYDWSGPDGFAFKGQNPQIPNMSIANAGTYTLQITNSTGCKNVFATDIVVNTVNFNGTYGPYCISDSPVTISVSPAGGTFTGPGMKGDIFDPKLAGAGTHTIQYTYTLSGGACSIIATKYIDVVTAPKLVINNPLLKSCSGTTADLTLPEVTAGSTPGLLLSYWQDSGATSALASPKSVAAGTYYIKGGTPSGKCSDIKPVQVLQPDSLRATMLVASGLKCSGDSTGSMTLNITMGTAPYTYLWDTQPAQTTDTIKNLPSGTYTVVLTDAKMCIASFTGKILEPAPIKLGFEIKSIMCRSDINGSARIDTINGSTDPAVLSSYTYLWETTPVQTTREAVRLSAFWQKVNITSPNGCIEKDSVYIKVMDNIPPVITCPKDVEMTVPYLKSDSPNKYTVKLGQPVATDNCSIDTLTNDAPEKFRKGLTYVIWTLTDLVGLMDTCTQRVFIREIPMIPQLISPNGDGLNDTFIIDGLTGEDYPDSQMLIYTRSGQLVFKSSNYELPGNAWDGRYSESIFSKKDLVATGVYYYILKLGGARSQTLKGYMYVYY